MPFTPDDWIDVKIELPEKKTWVRLRCLDNATVFSCLGWLETVDQEGIPHFYSLSDGWVDVLFWQEMHFDKESDEDH